MKKETYLCRAAQRAAGVWALLLLLASLDHVIAGSPIFICQSGSPLVWANGGVGIPFNPDQGNLGPLDHAQAVALVQAAFDVWQAVPTATATYVNAGDLPVNVDITNFAPFFQPVAPDGLNAVVFDDTGEIFDLLFGPNSGILGFAGPEWIDFGTCEILEGVAFLNGPAFSDATYALDVMVHEFGHYTGLHHAAVNGQIFIGDTTGPTPDNTFGSSPDITVVETMYPFYFGPGTGSNTLEADDVAMLSALYPEPGFDAGSGTIRGSILAANGVLRLTGVNVIARNIADPFQDAVSAISGDFSIPDTGDPLAGVYTLRGLTPGASYAVYVDEILAGGFSTPLRSPLPGPEEFYNGPAESNGLVTPDNPLDLVPVTSAAGGVTAGIDIIFNGFLPGQPLPLGDDDSIELPLPFPFTICGQTFNSVWVNANGNLTFGSPGPDFIPDPLSFLDGPPRIAGLWADLNPPDGGSVTYSQTPTTFSVIWKDVPRFPDTGANSFNITLNKSSSNIDIVIAYGTMTSLDGLSGLSGGYAITSGFESETDLSKPGLINLHNQPAMYELFTGSKPNDLSRRTLRFTSTTAYKENWAGPNDTLARAKKIQPPFSSATVKFFTEIEPTGGDVDFFKFDVEAGSIILARTTRGTLDSLLGLFAPDGQLIAFDDDSGPGLLSSLSFFATQSGTYAIAVSAYPDLGFTGAGGSGGRYFLDLLVLPPDPNNLIFNGNFERGFLGWTAQELGLPFISWTVSSAGDGSGFDMAPTQPQDGFFDALNGFDGDGPMFFTLYQDVNLRAGASTATLSWKNRVQWNYFVGLQTQPRTYEVQIRDPNTDAVLQTLFSFDTGIEFGLGDSGWTSHSIDVSPFIGSTVRIWFQEFIPEAFTGPGQFELDAVTLRIQ